MKHLRALSLLVVASMALPACFLQVSDGENNEALISQQQQQSIRLATALCRNIYACGCEVNLENYSTEAKCRDFISTQVSRRLKQGRDESLNYDPTCLDHHTELFEQIGCATYTEVALDDMLSQMLHNAERCRTYSGLVKVGQECEHLDTARGDECEPEATCSPDFYLCLDTRLRTEGEQCSYEREIDCAFGLVCDTDARGNSTCVQPPGVGQSCAETLTCGFGVYCDADTRICVAQPGIGDACEPFGSLEALTCRLGTVCDEGICVAPPGVGEPCAEGCQLGLICNENGACEGMEPVVCSSEASLP